jgi:phage-related protein
MTIRSSTSFNFAGENSEDYGLVNINISGGLQEEPFLAPRSIREVSIKGRKTPYFQEIEYEPLQFTVSFYFEEVWDSDKIRSVARWLGDQSYYQPLIFSMMPDRIFYVIFTDSPQLIHNCLEQGYVTLTARCDSPYSYSPVYTSAILDYSLNDVDGTAYTFVNNGDVICKPVLEVQIVSGSTFSIVNSSNGGQKLEFTGLTVGENLVIDCEAETIETDLSATYRYENMSSTSEFLSMIFGNNYLTVYGNIKLVWKYQYKTLQ